MDYSVQDFLIGWISKTLKSAKGEHTLTMVDGNLVTIIAQDRPYWYVAGLKEKAEQTYPEAKFMIEERPNG